MSRPPRRQLRLEVTAAVLLFAMTVSLCAVICLPNRLSRPSASPAPTAPVVHALPRSASNGVSYLYGEQDDYATECFRLGRNVYIVGTTFSHSHDMTSPLHGANLFVALVTDDTVLRVKVWGTDGNDSCIAAALTNDGLCVLAQSDLTPNRAVLYAVELTAFTVTAQTLVYPESVTPVALYADGTSTVVCASSLDAAVVYATVDPSGTSSPQALTYPNATLFLHAVYPTADGFDLLLTAHTEQTALPVLARLSDTTSVIPVQALLGSISASCPYEGGYALCVSSSDKTHLVTVARNGTHRTLASLPVVGRQQLYPTATGGFAVAAYERNAFYFVSDTVTAVELPDATLLAATLSPQGEPIFAVRHGDTLSLYGAVGKLRDLAEPNTEPDADPERTALLHAIAPAPCTFCDGALLFSSSLGHGGAEVGIVLYGTEQ